MVSWRERDTYARRWPIEPHDARTLVSLALFLFDGVTYEPRAADTIKIGRVVRVLLHDDVTYTRDQHQSGHARPKKEDARRSRGPNQTFLVRKRCIRQSTHISHTPRSLDLRRLLLPQVRVVAREEERGEDEERDGRRERAGVVRPRRAQEARVLVVPRRHDGHDRRAVQVRPPATRESAPALARRGKGHRTPCACSR
jgi:hypothetical protein